MLQQLTRVTSIRLLFCTLTLVILDGSNLVYAGATAPSVPRSILHNCDPNAAVPNCGAPPVQNGLYMLKSATKFPSGEEICLNVNTENGTYQQFNCFDVPSSRFYLTAMFPDQCYRFEQEHSGGRETNQNIQGVGIVQVNLNCASEVRSLEWQLVPVPSKPNYYQIKNHQTAKCIDVDLQHLERGGIVSPQTCQARDNQYWILF